MKKLVKYNFPVFRKGTLPLMLLAALLLGSLGRMKAQEITHIYTDYLGFWSSGGGDHNPVFPDYSNNLLGFTYNGTTYSTGVNDELLAQYGVGFVAMAYQALPVLNIPLASGDLRYVKFGQMQDGLHDGLDPAALFPYTFPISLSDVLTDGIQGLDIGTGVTNIDNADGSLIEMEYQFTTIDSPENIGDGLPDILVSQIAQPVSGNIDELWFVDQAGAIVGNKILIDQNHLPSLGKSMNDFYDPNEVMSNKIVYSERDIRISAYDAADFGMTTGNFHQARRLIYKMGGSSDPAFIAFNTDLLTILVSNNDQVTTDTDEAVSIKVLENDNIPEAVVLGTLVEMTPPKNGMVVINPDYSITYTPNPGFSGADSFKYEICSNTEACDFATVRVVVGAADMAVTNVISNDSPGFGDTVTFTVNVENLGPYLALNSNVISALPSGYEYVSSTVSRGSFSELSGYWALGNLASGDTATLSLKATVKSSGEYTSTARVSSAMYDPNPANNVDRVSPESFPSAEVSADCAGIHLNLTGQSPWVVTYTWKGEEFTETITSSQSGTTHSFNFSERGVFQLLFIEDGLNRTINFPTCPTTRLTLNPCMIITNPTLPSKAKQ